MKQLFPFSFFLFFSLFLCLDWGEKKVFGETEKEQLNSVWSPEIKSAKEWEKLFSKNEELGLSSQSWLKHLTELETFSKKHNLDASGCEPALDWKEAHAKLLDIFKKAFSLPNFADYLERELYLLRFSEPAFLTGYYTPIFKARKKKEGAFIYPIYAAPKEKLSLSRADIARAEKQGEPFILTANELAWLADPLQVYLVHVQGSALLDFQSGAKAQLAYAGDNGLGYVSLGKLLIQAGLISKEAMSLKAIENFFAQNPERFEEFAHQNPRYIFFKLQEPTAATGSVGAPVKAMMSVAMERFKDGSYLYPPLSLLLFELDKESNKSKSKELLISEGKNNSDSKSKELLISEGKNNSDSKSKELLISEGKEKQIPSSLLVFAQDTGSGIKGSARFDLYTGEGKKAEDKAGNLKRSATLFFLWPKACPLPKSLGGFRVEPYQAKDKH